MVTQIQLPEEFEPIGLPLPGREKSDKALRASLQELSEIADLLTEEAVKAKASKSSSDSSPSMYSLATAMYYLQLFQQAISNSQADQDKMQIKMGEAIFKNAESVLQSIQQKIAEANEAAEAASHRPWWEYLITAVMAVLSPLMGPLGIALAGVALLTSVPVTKNSQTAFDLGVQKLSSLIGDTMKSYYYNQYISEGKTPGEAKKLSEERAEGFGNFLAKLILSVAIGAAGGGVGGSYIGLATTFSTVAGSNAWADALTAANPNMDPKLQLGLNIGLEILTMGAALASGKMAYDSGQMNNFLEKFQWFANNAGYIVFASTLLQGAATAAETVMSGLRAHYLGQLADDYSALGGFEGQLQILTGGIAINQATIKVNNSAATDITKSNADIMNMLEQSSGLEWAATDQALRA